MLPATPGPTSSTSLGGSCPSVYGIGLTTVLRFTAGMIVEVNPRDKEFVSQFNLHCKRFAHHFVVLRLFKVLQYFIDIFDHFT